MMRLAVVAALLSATFLYFLLATAIVSRLLPLLAGWDTSAVMSGSMAPAIRPGDLIAFEPYGGWQLAPGTIVSFEDPARPGTTTTHRIVEVRDDGYVTKGDANPTADSTPVTPEMVRGVARMVYPKGAVPWYWWTTHQYGPLALLVFLTAVAMLINGRLAPRIGSESSPLARRRRMSRGMTVPTIGLFTAMAMVGVAFASFTSTTGSTGNAFVAAASFGPEPPSNLAAAASCPAAPTHVGATSGGGESAGVTIGQPAGVAPGDVMLASFITRQTVAVGSTPPGWQLLLTEGEMRVYHKIATASEPGQYSWGLSQSERWAGGITAYRGTDPNAPIDAFGSQTSPSGTSITAPSITTIVDDVRLVAIFGRQSRAAIGQPAGMTERWDVGDGGTGGDNSGVASEAADEAVVAPGLTGPRVAASTGNRTGYGALIALAPAGLRVTLTWVATPTATADGYVMERWTGGALDASWLITPATTSAFTDTTAQEGIAYSYRLRAFEGTDESTEVVATITPNC